MTLLYLLLFVLPFSYPFNLAIDDIYYFGILRVKTTYRRMRSETLYFIQTDKTTTTTAPPFQGEHYHWDCFFLDELSKLGVWSLLDLSTEFFNILSVVFNAPIQILAITVFIRIHISLVSTGRR